MLMQPVALTHHDHPDCEDYGYVIDTGLTCDDCRAAWWCHMRAEAGEGQHRPIRRY